jgi:O-antigen/teichoic acid export membrane protein
MSIGRKAGKGFFSFLYRSLLEKFMGVITMIVLAQKLTPYDFGLVIITDTVLTIIAALGTTGLAEFLLAYRKDDIDEMFKAAFWFNLAITLIMVLVFIGVAPLWAAFQKDQRIINISIITGIVFIFSQLQSIPKTWLSKNLMFDKQVSIQAPFIILIPLAKIAAVYLGLGVYSLVVPNLILQPILTAIFYSRAKVRPGIRLYIERWREIYHFTKYLIGSSILGRIGDQGNEVILSKSLGLDKLGIYDMAMRMSDILTGPLVAVSNNILSSILPKYVHDKERFYAHYFNFVKAFAFLVFPVLSVMLLTSKPVILLLYGPKWADAVVPMQILILYAAFRAVTSSYGSVMNTFHLNRKSFIVTLTYIPFYLVGSIIGSYFGVVGIAVAVLIVKVVFINWNIKQIMDALSKPFIAWYQSLSPYLLSSAVLVILFFAALLNIPFLQHAPLVVAIITVGGLFIVAYWLVFRIFFAKELQEISAFFGGTFPKMQYVFNRVFSV